MTVVVCPCSLCEKVGLYVCLYGFPASFRRRAHVPLLTGSLKSDFKRNFFKGSMPTLDTPKSSSDFYITNFAISIDMG